MADISGFNLGVTLIASTTYPTGIPLTQFSDDSDPFDVPNLQIADKAMGLNGDLVVWSTANPIELTLSMIPNGPDDEALQILLEANRVGRGKFGTRDIITLTRVFPDGKIVNFTAGKLTAGPPSSSVASSGRMKSNSYVFAFENRAGAF